VSRMWPETSHAPCVRDGRRRPPGFVLAGAAVVILFALGTDRAGPAGAASVADGVPVVTLIGDSVADALDHDYNAEARKILAQGIELRLEVAPCRRIAPDSCPYNGVSPPTVLELVRARGQALGPTVIVFVGHNDWVDQYARNIEAALAELEDAGVKRVLWSTLRAVRNPYVTMNDAIEDAAQRHPEMTVIEWNVYSRGHPDWFQEDEIHVNEAGVRAMATLFHEALVRLGIPVPPVEVATARLSDARTGVRYSAVVLVRGGREPYRWSFTGVPAGIHASKDGRLTGLPRGRLGTYSLNARVVDSLGSIATREIQLRLRPSPTTGLRHATSKREPPMTYSFAGSSG
jgi:hypothetical protein